MSLLSPAVFILPILTGASLLHLIWPERKLSLLFFKAFLGIGIGLGISSLLYFLYMLLFAGQHWFIFVQITAVVGLLIAVLWVERKRGGFSLPRWNLTRTQNIFLGIALVIFVVSLSSTISYLLRRKQGDWDAWMMYNRSALFVYRGQSNWVAASFSRQMDPIFHPDYPLLLAMNTAWGWEIVGSETPRIPMTQSALFAVACAGVLVSALASAKSPAQAALGLIVLWGTPSVVNEGAREMADLPLAFFILATGILIYFYVIHKKPALMVLAGLTAGLAAWTKNEGSLFVVSAAIAIAVAFLFGNNPELATKKENTATSSLGGFVMKFRNGVLPVLLRFVLGLAFPFAIVMGFKLFLAPPSDVLSNGPARSIRQILEAPRHVEIIQFFSRALWTFGEWTSLMGILPILVVYFLLFRRPINKEQRPAYIAGITILAVQWLGDYGVYLISPYDLTWHLSYSIGRIVLQVFPLIVFLILSAVQTPEAVFGAKSTH
jgi:hypothetical protein